MRKFTYSTPRGCNGQGQARREGEIEREREEGKVRCYRNASPPSPILPFLPRISRKAVLSPSGNFIFATNLQSLLAPCLPPVIPLFGDATLSLPWLELSAHFPSCNLRPTRTRRAWTDSSPGRIFTDVVATASQTYRTLPPLAMQTAQLHVPPSRVAMRVFRFRVFLKLFFLSIRSSTRKVSRKKVERERGRYNRWGMRRKRTMNTSSLMRRITVSN